MKIIIVGCGNVGATLAEQLSKEKHDITVIDTRQQAVEAVTNVCDVMGIIGMVQVLMHRQMQGLQMQTL